MPKTLTSAAILLSAFLGTSTAWAQSGDTSGAMSAETHAASPAASSTPVRSKESRSSAKQPKADMNTTAPAATGPDTSTNANNGDSDLSGSTGASLGLPAAPAPPGVAPPGGVPDTSNGGEAPNTAGGPH